MKRGLTDQQRENYPNIFEPFPESRATSGLSTIVDRDEPSAIYSPTHQSPILQHQRSLYDVAQEYAKQDEELSSSERNIHHSPQYKQYRQSAPVEGSATISINVVNPTIPTHYYVKPQLLVVEEQLQQHYNTKDEHANNTIMGKNLNKLLQRHQADNISIATSLFTAVDHLESELDYLEEEIIPPPGESHNTNHVAIVVDDDDNSSADNLRHGYLPEDEQAEYGNDSIELVLAAEERSVNALLQKLEIDTSVIWDDYRPQYQTLNDSYMNNKNEIYKKIYSIMSRMQELDMKFNQAKSNFSSEMEKNYLEMSDRIVTQCNELYEQRKEYFTDDSFSAASDSVNGRSSSRHSDNSERQFQQNEKKVKLNVGGSIFETSLSTLRRDSNSLLAMMFSGRHSLYAEADGSYFIDRDPSHFRLVLNYLRDLRVAPTVLHDHKVRQELLQEAKYYSVDGLVEILQQ